MRLLVAQKELALPYLPEFSSAAVLLSVILSQVEFEHEQLTILKLLIFLREWISEGFFSPFLVFFCLHSHFLFLLKCISS